MFCQIYEIVKAAALVKVHAVNCKSETKIGMRIYAVLNVYSVHIVNLWILKKKYKWWDRHAIPICIWQICERKVPVSLYFYFYEFIFLTLI